MGGLIIKYITELQIKHYYLMTCNYDYYFINIMRKYLNYLKPKFDS